MVSVTLAITWGKTNLDLSFDTASVTTVKALKQIVQEKTGVPIDRIKLMAKSKGLWKGLLKDDDAAWRQIDWDGAIKKSGSKPLSALLMGSATTVVEPAQKTVFVEDLPPEQAAAVQEPSGLHNLGNTCYMNSVVQCLRVVEPWRKALKDYRQMTSSTNAQFQSLMAALADTYHNLDRQSEALQPLMLVKALHGAVPLFAERNRSTGQPQQQDAEECLMQIQNAAATTWPKLQNDPESKFSAEELKGADNMVDAVFGFQLEETLTCDELTPVTDAMNTDEAASADQPLEPPVVSHDLQRKLVCNIQATTSDIYEGLRLGLKGSLEKHSQVLGRDAVWTKTQRLSRLPPVVVVQFGRFFWKATPDNEDYQGGESRFLLLKLCLFSTSNASCFSVKCKIMKPVTFTNELDLYEFCTPKVQETLKRARDQALKLEDERLANKLEGKTDAMDTDEADAKPAAVSEDNDAELQAAMAMSMQEDLPPVGPGLPANFQGHYELFAVVTHKGRDADSGHYMAWVKAEEKHVGIKKENEKVADSNMINEDWYVFDDDEVSPCKTEDVLKLKGGGDWHMSYLNFYRPKK